MMRLAALLLTAAIASTSYAGNIVAGGEGVLSGNGDGLYELSIGGVTNLGNGLSSLVLTVTNISGNPDFDINNIGDANIGSNGVLHNESPFGGAVATPTLASFEMFANGASPATDSHFLPDVALALTAPAEVGTPIDSFVAPAIAGGAASFGLALTGTIGIQAAPVVDIAQLVFASDLLPAARCGGIEFSFSVGDGSPLSPGETFAGVISTLCPEPSTAMLAGLGLLGFVARRR